MIRTIWTTDDGRPRNWVKKLPSSLQFVLAMLLASKYIWGKVCLKNGWTSSFWVQLNPFKRLQALQKEVWIDTSLSDIFVFEPLSFPDATRRQHFFFHLAKPFSLLFLIISHLHSSRRYFTSITSIAVIFPRHLCDPIQLLFHPSQFRMTQYHKKEDGPRSCLKLSLSTHTHL